MKCTLRYIVMHLERLYAAAGSAAMHVSIHPGLSLARQAIALWHVFRGRVQRPSGILSMPLAASYISLPPTAATTLRIFSQFVRALVRAMVRAIASDLICNLHNVHFPAHENSRNSPCTRLRVVTECPRNLHDRPRLCCGMAQQPQ
jgi:hypothetical protein